jgi:hypothetical protein
MVQLGVRLFEAPKKPHVSEVGAAEVNDPSFLSQASRFIRFQDTGYPLIVILLFPLPTRDIAVISIVTDHLLPLVGDMRASAAHSKASNIFSLFRHTREGHPLSRRTGSGTCS